MGSIAFQVSVAVWPNQFQYYAFLVKWVWIVCGLSWTAWLLSHPWVRKHVYARAAILPPTQSAVTLDPVPHPAARSKEPAHNVQFVGFKLFDFGSDLPGLALGLFCFENVLIPGKPIENFRFARLRVAYRDLSTGEVIAESFPAKWHGSPDAPIDILGGEKKCAVIASCIGSKWTTDSLREEPVNPRLSYGLGGTEYTRECFPLPLGRMKIEATLTGERNLSISPVSGVLTLGEIGSASFARDV